MLPRADLTGTRPLTQVEAPVPMRAGGDLREDAFTRLSQIATGKQFQADVLSRLAGNTYLVRIEGTEARVNLPAGTKVGDQLDMSKMGNNPRPTFLLSNNPEGESATLSSAGRLIDSVLHLAQQQGTGTAVNGRAPLLAAAPLAGTALATTGLANSLQDALSSSGVFYESHVQQWEEGSHSLAALLREPQAQSPRALAPLANTYPALARLMSQIGELQNGGKSMAEVLQNPQVSAALVKLMPELATAQPILARLMAQAGAPGIDSATAPATAAATTATTTAAATAGAATAAAKLTPAAQAMAEIALAHPALSKLLTQLGEAAQTGKSMASMLQAPELQAVIQQAKAELNQPQPALARLLQMPADASGKLPEALLTNQNATTSSLPTDADVIAKTALSTQVGTEEIQTINQQLHALEQRQIQWNGELWPGQKLDWEIHEESSRTPGTAAENTVWQSTVRLDMPALGKITANIRLSGGHLQMHLSVTDEATAQTLRDHHQRLANALDAAGVPLDSLLVKPDGQA